MTTTDDDHPRLRVLLDGTPFLDRPTGVGVFLNEVVLAKIQETGEYVYPDPMIDLRMGLKLGGLAVQQAMLDDVDDATVRLLRQWCEDCQAEIAKEPPAPPPMPNAAPGAPQPMPAAAE